jgi:Glu-tRNA(Gln) amidotransferase subunit E-like FAD-binding protein
MLEEDSARPNSGGNDAEGEESTKVYKLDRLGLPMVEIATDPDITSPEQAKEVALHIGDVLRSCKVRRGIGTIRQDVNVSIEGHPRIEIKGFQDVKMFIPTVEKEVKRQEGNLKGKKDLIGQVRNALSDGSSEFIRPMPGAARMYPETDLPLLRISKQMIDEAKRTLPKLRSELKVDLIKKGLRDDEIQILLKGDNLDDFNNLLKIINEPRFIYKVLIEIPKQVGDLDMDIIESIVYAVDNGKLDRLDVRQVMQDIVNGKSLEEALIIEKADIGDVESEIVKLVKEKPGLSVGGYMGLIMQKFKGKVNGKEVNAILNKLLK